ncbi:MAG: peptidoglycan DD-metalloendopeptidase family protein [Bacteroidales bacterium]|nr:peptidoglycan DD-metalloendopeptidase family protein [Bacteroidales bacterium]MDD4684893.1 peptidoglycan DD-metalloendopeptidase family protein [Bacteroidales bacterium]
MEKRLIIFCALLISLSMFSYAQNNKDVDLRSPNRRIADSLYALHNSNKQIINASSLNRSNKNESSKKGVNSKTSSESSIRTRNNNTPIIATVDSTKYNLFQSADQENEEKERIIVNNNAPCKTLYNNTWCTNKVKMPSFNFGEFPDEFTIKLIDERKDQSFHFPCDKGVKSSPYGWRWERPHGGIDFALSVGEPIYSVFDGVVRVAQVNGGYGNMILVRHYNNLETLYAHLSKMIVKVGQEVKAGDIIGYSGNTGFSTGPHLHFECRCLYQTFDPEWILDIKNRTLRTKHINIEKTFFGIERAEKQINKKKPVTHLVKINKTFEGKPYYSFKDKYANKSNTTLLAKGGNQPLNYEINNEDKTTWRYWKVRPGDTIVKLANRFRVTPRQIIEMNGLTNEKLTPNTKIRVR